MYYRAATVVLSSKSYDSCCAWSHARRKCESQNKNAFLTNWHLAGGLVRGAGGGAGGGRQVREFLGRRVARAAPTPRVRATEAHCTAPAMHPPYHRRGVPCTARPKKFKTPWHTHTNTHTQAHVHTHTQTTHSGMIGVLVADTLS